MESNDKRQVDATEQDTPLHVYLGLLMSFLAGMIGGLGGAYLGSIVQDGMVVVGAATVGFFLTFCLAAALTGPLSYAYGQFFAIVAPPDAGRVWAMRGFSSWDLYVTVHLVKNSLVTEGMSGWLTGKQNDSYLEVKVGRYVPPDTFKLAQPVKYTCVSHTNVFEESFHFVVSPTDDHLRIALWDQDIFADDMVGMCDINISDQILLAGFPQHKGFRLIRATQGLDENADMDHLSGTVVLSFRPGGAFPKSVYDRLKSQKPLHYEKLRTENQALMNSTRATAGSYGTWATGMPESNPTASDARQQAVVAEP
mmetsp:Transcript_819/g.2427  ORF Transcript_819/g.2427 Transcript_819/m.2427 type:complete len:310 (+) Transcript_819:136-1065(+)